MSLPDDLFRHRTKCWRFASLLQLSSSRVERSGDSSQASSTALAPIPKVFSYERRAGKEIFVS